MFNAGPKVVEGATFEEGLDFQDLGGPIMHCTNGTIDNLAANEAECFEQIRTVLGYLPNSGSEAPPVIPCDDPEYREDLSLRTIIPRRQARMYNPRTIGYARKPKVDAAAEVVRCDEFACVAVY